MQIAIENLPIVFLSIIGVGVAIIVISVVRLASSSEQTQDYYVANQTASSDDSAHLEELFSYFLEEEEKKNEAFRQLMLEQSKTTHVVERKVSSLGKNSEAKKQMDQNTFNEIIRRYEQGEDPQEIAKSLRKGIGEVKLILSLYTMR